MPGDELKALGKKALSLLVMFNSLVTFASSLGIIHGSLLGHGSSLCGPHPACFLLPFIALTATLNIIPVKFMGRADIRRPLFHHYVYGLLSILLYLVLAVLFSFIGNLADGQVYLAMPLYWGIALILDDVSDVSPRIRDLLNALKAKFSGLSNIIMWTHRLSSVISFYAAISMTLWHIGKAPLIESIAQTMFMVSSLITAVCGLKVSCGKVWLKYFNGL